jgi:hypothetical protein
MRHEFRTTSESAESLLDAMEGVCYVVDSEGVISVVGRPRWRAFAEQNNASRLGAASNVVGRSLLDFVQGEEVRQSYRSFTEELQSGRRQSVSFEFSCDAPEKSRRMRMCITPILAGGRISGFLFQSVLLEENLRPPIDLFDPQVLMAELAAARQLPILKMCSYCQFVAAPSVSVDAEWVSAETYYRRGGTSEVRMSHGICPGCMTERVGSQLL